MQFSGLDLLFPLAGLDVSRAFDQQTASVAPLGSMYDPSFQQQRYETTRQGINVRGFDALQNRFRGGSRPGLTKYLATQVSTTNALQAMGYMSVAGFNPPTGSTQTSTHGLLNYLIAVAGGTIKFTWPGATAWSLPTNGTTALNGTNFISMAAVNGTVGQTHTLTGGVDVVTGGTAAYRVFFCDGLTYKVWTAASGAVGTVSTPTSDTFGSGTGTNSLPSSGANKCRLSAVWRGRWVLSGLKGDDQNVFMSAVNRPANFCYSPLSPSATQAVALNPAGANPSGFGQTFDAVTCLAPINDDNLFIGCANSCFLMRGDPMAGGQLQCLEPGIGVYWNAWCRDTEGVLYFLSNKMGVYSFSQFDYPRLISQRVDPLLQQIVTGSNTVSMVWDDWLKGFHLFITVTATPTTSTTHYFWEKRTGAWWQDTYPTNVNPLCCSVFDGNRTTDRRTMLGCNDGYVRYVDFSATQDDGTNIASSVVLGPIVAGFSQLMLRELHAILDTSSAAVTWSVYAGTSAQQALSNTATATGTWSAGLNPNTYVRRSGKALYLKLSATGQWGMERVRAMAASLGATRERSGV